MTISDLVNKIYSLNDVKDKFWIDYLERIRSGMKVSWYHSSGFDLRPFIVISNLTKTAGGYYNGKLEINEKYDYFSKIGVEIKNTDFVYSDWGYPYPSGAFLFEGFNLYDVFLNMWEKKRQGVLINSDLPSCDVTQCDDYLFWGLTADAFLSIEPFRIFTKEERKTFARVIVESGGRTVINEKQEYDGFAIKLAAFAKSHITIIFICLDNRIVKKIFEHYNIEVVCVFENRTNDNSGIDFNSHVLKNVKYIFTDNYGGGQKGEGVKLRLHNSHLKDYKVWDFWHEYIKYDGIRYYYRNVPIDYSKKENCRGTSFCLAIKKSNENESINEI